jgi:hypothetical protein
MLDDIFFMVVFFKSLASQGSKKKFLTKCLACSTPSSDSVYHSAPWEVLIVDTGNGYHLLHHVDGGPPGGAVDRPGNVHHRV